MASRALGALFALAAAIAFVVSIASSAWWAGSPTVDGQTIHAKDVQVGLLGAKGCNLGGDGTCDELTSGLETAIHIELGAIGLAIIVAFALTISAFTVGDRRKGLATLNLVVTLLAAAGAGALLALGPDIQAEQRVVVPIGWGTYVFGGAVASSLLASLIARKLEPEPLRLKTGHVAATPTPDVREIVREQNGGLAPRESAPLIGGAPQLRPFYDPNNAGLVPAPPSPSLPVSPPTPYPRDQVKALTGNYTPTPERVNPLGSANPGVANPITALGLGAPAPSPSSGEPGSNPAATPLGPALPKPGEAVGQPIDPFARTAPRDNRGEAPPMAPPPNRAKPPSAAPLPNRAKPPSAAPLPARTNSPSSPPAIGGASRTHSPSTSPASRPSSPSTSPAPRPNSPSTPPASGPRPNTPSAPPSAAARMKASSVPAPNRPATPALGRVKLPSAAPLTRRARTTPGPGTPTDRKPADMSNEPELRPSAPTLAHAVPPMPTPEATPPPAVLSGREVTAVEIDAEAKAQAAAIESTARGTGLDPRILGRPIPLRSATEARTGKHEATAGDVTSTGVNIDAPGDSGEVDGIPEPRSTETGVDILAAPPRPRTTGTDVVAEPPAPPRIGLLADEPRMTATHYGAVPEPDGPRVTATTIGAVPEPAAIVDSATMFEPSSMLDSGPVSEADTGVKISPAPPASSARILTGQERVLSTMQRNVARAPTEDPFEGGRAASIVPPDGPLSDELASPRSAEIAAAMADEAPVTEVHSIPSASELADELAAQNASGTIGETTDMKRASDLLPAQRETESTPIPTFHGRPSGQLSTAPSSLPPPRTVEAAPSGPRPACPQCESPMAWVEEHLRFYCKQCRMYF